ncbi:MAG: S9 family peptidase [Duncaniella sp.]|nr:S9 family peptidase [Duncaniella sp.]
MKRLSLLLGLLIYVVSMRGATSATYDFAVVDGDTLRMDVYMPGCCLDGPAKPAVIFAFGGGFKGGERDNDSYKKYFDFLCSRGVAVISTDYRTSLAKANPGELGSVEGFAKAVQGAVTDAVTDFYKATAFVLAHAGDWGIDPAKIIASGSSAGAITALQAEYVLANGGVPVGVFPEGFNYAAVVSFAGAVCTEGDIAWKSKPCPMMLFHGDADRNVPYDELGVGGVALCGSRTIATSLAGVGVACEFYTFAGSDHSIAISPMQDRLYTIFGFVNRICSGKERSSVNAFDFVPGVASDYQTEFTIADYIKANM